MQLWLLLGAVLLAGNVAFQLELSVVNWIRSYRRAQSSLLAVLYELRPWASYQRSTLFPSHDICIRKSTMLLLLDVCNKNWRSLWSQECRQSIWGRVLTSAEIEQAIEKRDRSYGSGSNFSRRSYSATFSTFNSGVQGELCMFRRNAIHPSFTRFIGINVADYLLVISW